MWVLTLLRPITTFSIYCLETEKRLFVSFLKMETDTLKDVIKYPFFAAHPV